jgi:hypothetical protein
MEIDESKIGVVRKPCSPTAVAPAREAPPGSTAEGPV